MEMTRRSLVEASPSQANLDQYIRTIRQRWLVEDEERCTLQELGARFGISAERVRQLERRAVSQLRKQVERELPTPGRA